MTVKIKSNVRKRRGHTTHGHGSRKKNRGAGNRGGVGMAGSGKRADQKKPSILKEFGTSYFGKQGFVSRRSLKKIKVMNIGYLDSHIEEFVKSGVVVKEGDVYVVECKKMKIDKVLGRGDVKNKFKIKVNSISPSAVEKIKKAGGEVINNESVE